MWSQNCRRRELNLFWNKRNSFVLQKGNLLIGQYRPISAYRIFSDFTLTNIQSFYLKNRKHRDERIITQTKRHMTQPAEYLRFVHPCLFAKYSQETGLFVHFIVYYIVSWKHGDAQRYTFHIHEILSIDLSFTER